MSFINSEVIIFTGKKCFSLFYKVNHVLTSLAVIRLLINVYTLYELYSEEFISFKFHYFGLRHKCKSVFATIDI